VRPSPRDIPEVLDAHKQIKCHKVWAKYFDEASAYRRLRNFFLYHKEYTHFVICPDDLIVTPEVFEGLRRDMEEQDFPVLAGLCNLNYQDLAKPVVTYSCCLSVSGLQFITSEYLKTHSGFQKMGHEAFACTWVRRDVLEKIPLNGLNFARMFNEDGWMEVEGRSFDWAFSIDCAKHGIPIHVDLDQKMIHLANRLGNGLLEKCGIGLYRSKFVYET
jgi:hypothetical protein